jgi:hypothetical protein
MGLKRRERFRPGREAKARVQPVDLDPDERVQERKGRGDIASRAQRLDDLELGE